MSEHKDDEGFRSHDRGPHPGFRCELCGGFVPCSNYGDGDCGSCGVQYCYDEGQALVPTPEQAARWNASVDLVAACEYLSAEPPNLKIAIEKARAALAKAKPTNEVTDEATPQGS